MATRPGVLVTRPAGQGAGLCAAVEAAGCAAHSLPLLQLFPLSELPPAQRARLLALDEYRHVIFISGNAVQFGMAWIESYWPQLPLGITWYAVGAATAGALRDYGVSALTPGLDMTSEGLLALPQLQALADERVLIIKGEGGRATLREALSRRGARVDELACYRRGPPQLEPADVTVRLAQWQIELAMISSGEGLANLLALLSPAETSKFIHITLLVPSDRVARIAREAGFSRVIVAENASDSAMLRALAQWQNSAGD